MIALSLEIPSDFEEGVSDDTEDEGRDSEEDGESDLDIGGKRRGKRKRDNPRAAVAVYPEDWVRMGDDEEGEE